jgi:hypothetical protein
MTGNKQSERRSALVARSGVWSLTFMLVGAAVGCSRPPAMGERATTQLPSGPDKVDAELTVRKILVEPSGGECKVVVNFAITNTGKREIVIPEYDQAHLRDARDCDFKGASCMLSRDVGPAGKKGMFRAEPGATAENWVAFKIPRDAFSGTVRFGFVPYFRRDGEDLHGATAIFQVEGSSYSFEKPASFTDAVWK